MLEGLRLERSEPGRYQAAHVDGHGSGLVVFGGQLLAQMVMAASDALPGKALTSLQVVYARPARLDQPILIDVDVLHAGRSAASATVGVHQGEGTCVAGVALALAPLPDLGRHAVPMPDTDPPAASVAMDTSLRDVELRVVGGVDLGDPRGGQPAELHLWMRCPGAPDDADVARAMLAYVSELYFVGTALRPHEGLSQDLAFSTFIPAAVSHGLHFHAPFKASQWLLLALSIPHYGAGRVAGRADVFTEAGVSVASCWHENLLRPMTG